MSKWFLGEIVAGVQNSQSFASGRHVWLRRAGNRVHVVAAGGKRAVLDVAAAARHLRTVRTADGKPLPVKQRQADAAWSHWDSVQSSR